MAKSLYGSHCVSKQRIVLAVSVYFYLFFILTQYIKIVLRLQILISWLWLWYSFAFYSHHLLKDCLNTTLNSLDHCVMALSLQTVVFMRWTRSGYRGHAMRVFMRLYFHPRMRPANLTLNLELRIWYILKSRITTGHEHSWPF